MTNEEKKAMIDFIEETALQITEDATLEEFQALRNKLDAMGLSDLKAKCEEGFGRNWESWEEDERMKREAQGLNPVFQDIFNKFGMY